MSYLLAAASLVVIGATALTVGPQFLAGSDQDNDRGQPSVATSECTSRVRMNGVIYMARTYTEGIAAAPIGSAELAACDDNGEDPRGAYFPGNPEVVHVWSLGGFDPAQVIGVRISDGFFVYIASGMAPSERQRIISV